MISSKADIPHLEASERLSAAHAIKQVAGAVELPDPVSALAVIMFNRTGCDPLDTNRGLNLIEQVNQTFTYWASCSALRWLFEHHPNHAPHLVNLGTAKGRDIASADGCAQAEVFAATHPASNEKLRKDSARSVEAEGDFRNVFYLSPEVAKVSEIGGVRVIRLPYPAWKVSASQDSA